MSQSNNYVDTFMRGSHETLESRYNFLAGYRENYCHRAEECSKLTDPYLFPPQDQNGEKLASPWQSAGAEGVTSLSSRILSIILPPNRPPFRLRVEKNPATPEEKKQWQEIEATLAQIEKMVTAHIEALGDRVVLAEVIPHLLVTGNALLHVRPDGMKMYSLRDYVVTRNPRGEAIEIIVREKIDPRFLSPEDQERVGKVIPEEKDKPRPRDAYYNLYTQIKRKPTGGWVVRQECKSLWIGRERSYPDDACPWLALRMYRINGEDYGRGYTEKYLGDHKALEALMHALVDGAAAAAKVNFLVNPNGTVKPKQLEKAPNLGILAGKADEVTVLQVQKTNDFRTAAEMVKDLTQRLARAYLLNSAIQRDAERVTAEEIRYMAQELESALGGMYSILASEFQRPYVRLRMYYMQRAKLLPDLGGEVDIEIVTGIDALGRGQDTNRLTQFIDVCSKTLGEASFQYINVSAFMKALASSIGIDDISLLKTDDQIQQEQQQQQQMMLLNRVAPNAVNQLGNLAGKSMETQAMNTQNPVASAQ